MTILRWLNHYRSHRTSNLIQLAPVYNNRNGFCYSIADFILEKSLDRLTLLKCEAAGKTGFLIIAEPEELKYNSKTGGDVQFSTAFGATVAMLYFKWGAV